MSKIAGYSKDIYDLIIRALVLIREDDINIKDKTCLMLLTDELNKNQFQGKYGFNLRFSHLYKSYFLKSQRIVNKLKKGNLGLSFTIPDYLNRLSMYVYQESYENHYGKFDGELFGITQGLEPLPIANSNIDNSAFLNDLQSLGITGTANKLSTSQFEPIQCIEETKHTLFFMGLLGSKWVKDKQAFKEFLKKVQSKPDGRVRYLMINPLGKNFQLLKTMRGEHLKDESTPVFRDLVKEFECLEAKFYDFLPCFRLIFIDNKIVAVSRYKLDENNYIRSKQGWEAPHIVVDANQGDWSLYEPFLSYYETIWKQAIDIKNL